MLTRPSHFMLLLLLLTGLLVCFGGELLVPEPGKARGLKRGGNALLATGANSEGHGSAGLLNPVLINTGRSDMLGSGTDRKDRGLPADDVSQESKDRPSSPISNDERLNTLVGNIWREIWTLDKKATAMSAAGLPVNLELVAIEVDAAKRPSPIVSTCDAEGKFVMPEIPGGHYLLRALLADDSENLSISIELEIPHGAPKEQDSPGNSPSARGELARANPSDYQLRQDILLPYHRTMQGTLISKNGSDLTGIKISVREGGIERGVAIVDEEGKFSLPRVGKGPFEFNLQGQKGSEISLESAKTLDESNRQIPVSLSMQ